MKIRERFKFDSTNFTFKIASPTKLPRSINFNGANIEMVEGFFKGLNPKLAYEEGAERIGEVNEETHLYDGMIRYVQRNETNSMAQFIRTDSVPYEPGIFIPFTGFYDSPKIFTNKQGGGQEITVDMLEFLNNLSEDIWKYLFLTMILWTIFLFYCAQLLAPRSRFGFLKKVLGYVWKYFLLVIDLAPENVDVSMSSAVLWTFIVLAAYYGLHIILMSTFTTDLMKTAIEPTVDTLYDLLYDTSFKFKPTILGNLNMYNLLKGSPNGTEPNVLFNRLQGNGSGSIVTYEVVSPMGWIDVLSGLFEAIRNGTIAVVENSNYWTMSAAMICHMFPEKISNFHTSTDPILPSYLSFLVSHDTPVEAVKLFRHRVGSVSEMALLQGTAQVYSYSLRDMGLTSGASIIDGIICQEKSAGTYTELLSLTASKLQLSHYHSLLLICSIILMAASFSLAIEILHSVSSNLVSRKKVKGRRVRNHY